MSLIHWWPLNGDTKDYGINHVDLTNGNGAINNNGKIGKCYYLSHSAGFTGNFTVRDLMSGTCSFSLWLKIPETEYKARVNAFTYDSSHILMNSRIFGTNGSYSNTGLCLALQTNNIYSSGSHTAQYLYMGWRDNGSASVWSEVGISLNTWYHIVITKDIDRKMCMYLNGTKIAGPFTATSGSFSESYFYINNAGVWGSGNYNNSNAPMLINDFRIYDHALSAKEVKEISKALVLHYDFNDPYVEATTNYGVMKDSISVISGLESDWKVEKLDRYTVKVTALKSNPSYSTYGDIVGTLTGTKYVQAGVACTLSCEIVDYKGSLSRIYPCSGGFGSIVGFGTFMGRVYRTITHTSNWTHDIRIRTSQQSNIVAGDYLTFRYTQIEEKDHPTPYTPDSRSAGTVFDCSGYGYNGNVSGNLQILKESYKGNYCAKFDSNVYVDIIKELPNFSEGTFSFWINIGSNNAQAYRDIFSKKNNLYNGLWISLNTESRGLWAYQGDNSPSYCKAGDFLNANTWVYCSFVFKTNVGMWYLNGVQIGTSVTYTGHNYITGGSYALGDAYTGTSFDGAPFIGKIADFKIYAIALSASDILAEYNRKASIDKNGNLFTGEFVESSLNNLMQITSYGIATQTWSSGLSNYTQANCQVSLTKDGLRIYRTPNHDGRSQEGSGWDNWGGMRLTPLSIDPNLLQKGHSYILKWHVKGQTCDSIDPYFTNQMGWGGGGLDPNPSNVERTYLPAGFIGEKDCYYKFTINDDVYKVCTRSYSGFVQGETYPSYRDFAFGASYSITNDLGTDLYITNIRLYDITNLSEQQIKILKTNIITCEDFYEGPDINVRFEKSGTISVKSLKEI